jgi:3-deoxy-manno-octulosonate cytidylyltransferase (CMP-KDO synthetase)
VVKPSVLILIPARFASVRLPGKPLIDLCGRSLIARVADIAKACADELEKKQIQAQWAVVCDHRKVEEHCQSLGLSVVRVDDDVPSGSERLYRAYQRYFAEQSFSLILNIQGDEPLLKVADLVNLVSEHLSAPEREMMTLVHPFALSSGLDSISTNPNRVKVAFSEESGQCLYFSRAPIPFVREERDRTQGRGHLHIGVYSYQPRALEKFCKAPEGRLERLERLEQLRAMELGMRLYARVIDYEPQGVDTPEDKALVEGVLRGEDRLK